MNISAGVVIEDDESWVSLLDRAQQFKDRGDFPRAIYLAETCAARFAGNLDARGWALFALFRILLEYRGADAAVPLVLEILSLNSNLASKLHAVSVALDEFDRSGSVKRAAGIIRALDECITRWRSASPSPDDIAIPLAIQVLHQCAAIGMAGGRNLKFAELKRQGRRGAQLPAHPFEKLAPYRSNSTPDRIKKYMQAAAPQGVLSIVELDGATMMRCGGLAVVFDAHDQILPINYDFIPDFYVEPIRLMRKAAAVETFIPGRTFSMLDEFNNGVNFCHWMVDYLPRALLAADEGVAFDTLVGPAPLSFEFQTRSLQDLLATRRYLSLEAGTAYRFETLVYADNFAGNLNHPLYGGHPALRQKLMRVFPAALATAHSKRPLYVPRKTSRRVINDDALWHLLETRGFVRIDTDAMRLDDQVAAFRNASHVVAPHGAALTSIAFCEEGTDILELFPKFGGSAAFYAIAMASGLRYSCYSDISDGQDRLDETFEIYVNEAPIHVDLTFVSAWLDAVGLGRTSPARGETVHAGIAGSV